MWSLTFEHGSDRVRTVAFSFDGKVLASGGDDSTIILWDPNKGERLTELKGHRLAELFFSVSPGHRGRGVEKLTKNLTFGRMAAIASVAYS
jgi:WD40 repeat protein